MRILLAEDDQNFANILIKELEGDSNTIDWVVDGVEVVMHLMRHPCDVVLLDLRLPRLDGLSALRIIHILHPEISVVTYSGRAGRDELEDSVRAGAVRCLAKPFRLEDLKQILKETQGNTPGERRVNGSVPDI